MQYTNVYEKAMSHGFFFNIFIGGRGIGKTFSCLRDSLLHDKTIMYVRRTDVEIENCANSFTNPFKAVNKYLKRNVTFKAVDKFSIIVDETNEEDKRHIGYGVALSTFGKLRGADFSDVDIIIFDEFINTGSVDYLRGKSASLLFNLIETVNRNRELDGHESVKVILLSNANSIDDNILRSLDLASKIHLLKVYNNGVYSDEERGIYLELLENEEVREAKEETALYKLTKGTTFYDMSIGNEFTSDYFGDVKKLNYNEVIPLVAYEGITFYKHKSKDLYYASKRRANCDTFTTHTRNEFKRLWGYSLLSAIERGSMRYLDYDTKLEVKEIF